MKIYTIQRMDKFDYDFSIELKKCGCFTDKEEAKEAAKRAYESLRAEYADEIEQYSDEEKYRDIDEGLLEIEEDDENGYYQISFGYEEDYEVHNIAVNEWDLDSVFRDDLLVTAGSRVAYMDVSNIVKLPEGPDGEREISIVIAKAVDEYINNDIDESYDLYIEDIIKKEFGVEGNK